MKPGSLRQFSRQRSLADAGHSNQRDGFSPAGFKLLAGRQQETNPPSIIPQLEEVPRVGSFFPADAIDRNRRCRLN